jgi:xylulose-5-phosphate/fructose-6-phosphate phosphoketolase
VLNRLDRFHLVEAVVTRVPSVAARVADVQARVREMLAKHRAYVTTHGNDLPEVRDWQWSGGGQTPRP